MDHEEFWTAYGKALVDHDVETTVAHYGFPCMAMSDDFVGTLAGPDELRAALEQAHGYYARFGMTGVRPEIVGVDEISEKLTRVRLRWHFTGPDGAPLVVTNHEYTVRADADRPRIHLTVAIDEAQKLAALQGS
jgi:limonene-1,2-epoxide hydrolase